MATFDLFLKYGLPRKSFQIFSVKPFKALVPLRLVHHAAVVFAPDMRCEETSDELCATSSRAFHWSALSLCGQLSKVKPDCASSPAGHGRYCITKSQLRHIPSTLPSAFSSLNMQWQSVQRLSVVWEYVSESSDPDAVPAESSSL
jgi:hypothetical protein